MLAGAYTLDLYCDNEEADHPYGEFPHQFVAETGGECRRRARKRGRIISAKRVVCPLCTERGPSKASVNGLPIVVGLGSRALGRRS